MTDKTEQASFRGEWAHRLLNDELLNEAFATIEQEYTQQWINSPARDEAGRHDAANQLPLAASAMLMSLCFDATAAAKSCSLFRASPRCCALGNISRILPASVASGPTPKKSMV